MAPRPDGAAAQTQEVNVAELTDEYTQDLPPEGGENDVDFPYAPEGWSRERARAEAKDTGLKLTDDHWRAVHALQQYHANHGPEGWTLARLNDLLEEHFHPEGGMKYLHTIFPKGPIVQGSRLAGLEPPRYAADDSFGSEA